MSTLVETDASDLFISKEFTRKLNLQVEKGAGCLKTVNSKEVPTCGVARDVEVHIGQWRSKETLKVIPLDKCDHVISFGFLNRIGALFVMFDSYICILDTQGQGVIPVKHESERDLKV